MSAPARLISFAALLAAAFGLSALAGAAIGPEPREETHTEGGHDAGHESMRVELRAPELPRGRAAQLRLRIVDDRGSVVRDLDVVHERLMHLIVVRDDLTGFQHLHPSLGPDGVWHTPITLPEPGTYRVFADFERDGERYTPAADLRVDGAADAIALPEAAERVLTDGYEVALDAAEDRLAFSVTRDGEPVTVQPYLGAGGHLVALREGDLHFLHVHPTGSTPEFEVTFPSDGRYRLFLQFRHDGEVHTAAFTKVIG